MISPRSGHFDPLGGLPIWFSLLLKLLFWPIIFVPNYHWWWAAILAWWTVLIVCVAVAIHKLLEKSK